MRKVRQVNEQVKKSPPQQCTTTVQYNNSEYKYVEIPRNTAFIIATIHKVNYIHI